MSEPLDVFLYQSPVGEILLAATVRGLCLCDWRYRKQRERIDDRIRHFTGSTLRLTDHVFSTRSVPSNDPTIPEVIREAVVQLNQYFNKTRQQFDVPLDPLGTAFQKSVWDALQNIPYGETRSYKQLAEQLQQPSAIRAVAAANGANALSIFIPCHRIIGSSGELVGYAGGLPAKKRLLELEQPTLFDN